MFFIGVSFTNMMPRELKTVDDLTDDILKRTLEVYTKRTGDFVKYKFRTPKILYTIKVDPDNAGDVENRIGSFANLEVIPV